MPRKKLYTTYHLVKVITSAVSGAKALEESSDELCEYLAGTEHEVIPFSFHEGHGDSGFVDMMPDTIN